MKYVVITNNEDVIKYVEENQNLFEGIYVDGNIRDVVFTSRDKILDNYTLVVDPLCGRKERPMPYLSVVLKQNDKEDIHENDIIRVEWFVGSYCDSSEFLDSIPKEKMKDYRVLDTSLTKNACKFLNKAI